MSGLLLETVVVQTSGLPCDPFRRSSLSFESGDNDQSMEVQDCRASGLDG